MFEEILRDAVVADQRVAAAQWREALLNELREADRICNQRWPEQFQNFRAAMAQAMLLAAEGSPQLPRAPEAVQLAGQRLGRSYLNATEQDFQTRVLGEFLYCGVDPGLEPRDVYSEQVFDLEVPDPDQWFMGVEWEPQLTFLNWGAKPVYVQRASQARAPVNGGTRLIEIQGAEGSGLMLEVDRGWLVGVAPGAVIGALKQQDGCYPESFRLFGVDHSVYNLEIRTRPIRVCDFSQSVEEAESWVMSAVKSLAAQHGPTAMLLPRTDLGVGPNVDPIVTKHVSFSLSDRWQDCATTSLYSVLHRDVRLHMKVPYQFDEYELLLEAIVCSARRLRGKVSVRDFISITSKSLKHLLSCKCISGLRSAKCAPYVSDERPWLIGYSQTGEGYTRVGGLL